MAVALVMPSLMGCEVVECGLEGQYKEPRTLVRCRHVDPTLDKQGPWPLPPVAMDQQEVLRLDKQQLYDDLAARGLQYSMKYQVINSIAMGETGTQSL